MKGLKAVARDSKAGLNLYYDIETKTVNLKGKGYFVTVLLRKNTEKEIEQAVNRWLTM